MTDRIALTMGDPGGIGPEILIKSLNYLSKKSKPNVVVIGDKALFSQAIDAFGKDKKALRSIDVINPYNGILGPEGTVSAENGSASFSYVEAAVDLAMNDDVSAIVTGPINKEAWDAAGVGFSGHTTFLKSKTGADDVSMGFYTDKLCVVLATIHVPLMQVSAHLTEDRLVNSIAHAYEFMEQLEVIDPGIAVAGLNPHAGENGLFGTEDRDLIAPIVHDCFEEGLNVTGPHSGDTVFKRAYDGEFDCVVAMYHDQGLIPIKLLAFDEAVNVTLGLPFVRTSPDHGTAFDIVGQNKASAKSMINAIELAEELLL
jgi:4-hydroxythreonine-4-phosphate dehydrogenase